MSKNRKASVGAYHTPRDSDVLSEVLRSEGLNRNFASPGTAEVPPMNARPRMPDIRHVWALPKASAVKFLDIVPADL
jgi:hypothetical protein